MANTDPNRPEIITRTAFGGRSSVALGGNRYSTKSESLYRWANAIALPARGLVVDAGLWVSGFAVGFRLPFSLMTAGLLPYYMGLAIMLLVLIPPVCALGMVAESLPDHRGDCWARLGLILIALTIATNGFWLRGAL
jgi:hypothetical protein